MAPEHPSAGAPQPRPFEGFNAEREALKALAEKQEKQELGTDLQKLQGILAYAQHPLFVLPEGATVGLKTRQAYLQERVTLFTEKSTVFNVGALSLEKTELLHGITRDLLSQIAQFEYECAQIAQETLHNLLHDASFAPYRAILQNELGISGGVEGFKAVVEELSAPLSAPRKEAQQTMDMYQDLQMRQYQLIDSVFNLSLLTIRDAQRFPDLGWAKGLSPQDRAAALRTLGAFLIQKRVYEGLLHKEPENKPPKALLFLGVAAEELAEEGVETLRFGKPVIQPPEALRGIDSAVRSRMLQGYEGAKKMIGAKVPPLADVALMIRNSPVGKEFWSKLLEVESPVTVVMFMMYVNMSDNKLKAVMNFASFMAVSAGSGAMLETVSLTLAQGARLAAAANKLKTAHALTVVAGLPKHPVVQFTAALAIAIGLSPVIDLVTTWVDEKIPESAGKRGVQDFITVGSGSSIIDAAKFGLTEIGTPGMAVNPEKDAIDYLALELPTIVARKGQWWPTLERDKMNDMRAWNEKVDIAIAQEPNPILRERYKLEKADVGAWTDREAFYYFGQTKYARDLEAQIGQALVERNVLSNAGSLDFVELATSDNPGEERPDYTIKQLEDTPDTPQSRAKNYIEGLKDAANPQDRELYAQWKEYRRVTDDLARHTVVFSHLGIYNRQEWLGNNAREPAFTDKAQRGIAAEVSRMIERENVTQSTRYSDISASEYAQKLTDTVPYVRPQTLLQWLNLAESHTEEEQQEMEQFKTFLRLNANYIHGKDLDAVLMPIARASLSGRRATYEDLKKVYTLISDFLFERSLKETQINPLPEADLKELRINPRIAFEQRGVFASDKKELMKLLNQNGEFRHSMYGDCLLMRTAEYSSFFRVECVIVLGRSPDRSTWRMAEISTIIPRMVERGQYVYGHPQNSIPRSIPYAEWMKAHPEDAVRFTVPLDALEAANRALEEAESGQQPKG